MPYYFNVLLGLSFMSFIFIFFFYFDEKVTNLEKKRKNTESVVLDLQNSLKREDHVYQHGLEKAYQRAVREQDSGPVLIYNRIPKTGSTTVMGLAYELCKANRYNVLRVVPQDDVRVLSVADQVSFVENVTTWKEKHPAIYHGHFAFMDFSKFGVKKIPLYINMIRRPMDRMVSYFYFLRYGDDFRPEVHRPKEGDSTTLDECVERNMSDCHPNHMWLQIPFFCGDAAECWSPGSQWALQTAKQNVASKYLIVGLTEKMEDFLSLLEFALPNFFLGATRLYGEGNRYLRKTMNKMEPSPKTVERLQSSTIWKMEAEFYDFVARQFQQQKKRQKQSQGTGFFYEKIRGKSSAKKRRERKNNNMT